MRTGWLSHLEGDLTRGRWRRMLFRRRMSVLLTFGVWGWGLTSGEKCETKVKSTLIRLRKSVHSHLPPKEGFKRQKNLHCHRPCLSHRLPIPSHRLPIVHPSVANCITTFHAMRSEHSTMFHAKHFREATTVKRSKRPPNSDKSAPCP